MRAANIPSKAACPASLLATPHPKSQEVNALAPGFFTAKLQNFLKTKYKNLKKHGKTKTALPYSNKLISPVGLMRVFPKCL